MQIKNTKIVYERPKVALQNILELKPSWSSRLEFPSELWTGKNIPSGVLNML